MTHVIVMWYASLTKPEETVSPVSFLHGDDAEDVMSFVAPSNGASAMVAHRAVHWTNGFGHGKVLINVDQAPALVELQDVSGEERLRVLEGIPKFATALGGMGHSEVGSVVPEHSPVGGPKSNGAIETAITRKQLQLRTITLAV